MIGVGCMLSNASLRKILSDNPGLRLPKTTMTMTFGPSGFFGSIMDPAVASSLPPASDDPSIDLDRDLPSAGWWATYEMSPVPPARTPYSALRAAAEAKHKSWHPLAAALVAGSDPDDSGKGTMVLPRWITPPLPHWHSASGRLVVLGDAAHCMPPDSGQGVSCAVEDAMALGLILAATSDGDLAKAASMYEKVRKPRCEWIVAEAKKRGNMKRELGWWEQGIRNGFIWAMCRVVPQSMNDGMFGWECAKEVQKVLNGEEPAVKGKGRVLAVNASGK